MPVYQLRGIEISPDNKLAAYGEDNIGRRKYTLRIKNLETGELLPDKIENTTGSAAMGQRQQNFVLHTRKDPETLRAFQIYKHKLGRINLGKNV